MIEEEKEKEKDQHKWQLKVRFPREAVEAMKEIKEKIGAASYVEVIKTALGLLDHCVEVLDQGGKVIIIDAKGEKESIILPSLAFRGILKRWLKE